MDGGEPGDSEIDGGVSGGGEAGESGVVRQWIDGGEPGDGELDGGVSGGGEAGTAGESSVARQWRGERGSSYISSGPRSSSASLRLFLSRLAGEGSANGGEGCGGDRGGIVAVCVEGVPSKRGAAVTGNDGCGHS
jgi:hypothetical protein